MAPPNALKILIIGGSRFIGPLIIERLLKKNHSVTIFNRGLVRQSYPDGARFIKGNRNNGFPFKERFDAIIDTCAYKKIDAERATQELKFDFFVHLSTAAVYKKGGALPLAEESELGEWPLWGGYNKGKVECEEALKKSGIKYAAIRPVYILGPKNYTPRESFIYSRIKNGVPLILPGDGGARIQFVFAEEVASAMVLIAENQVCGAFNCAGDDVITPKELVEKMGGIARRKPIIQYNPSADGTNFDAAEFPFANESLITSNEKIKKCGVKFLPLFDGLKTDYNNYYRHVV